MMRAGFGFGFGDWRGVIELVAAWLGGAVVVGALFERTSFIITRASIACAGIVAARFERTPFLTTRAAIACARIVAA
uniref:hypothetical protein n=1 Tax=Caballeronia concitans TaxID=1777133 RepID=UPI0035B54CA4